ncbi:S-acyltransferase [Melia azedarach]|uniref:S-acyltransferase n=1 Tax=Melia azedarach TaxID=155640 RepID=A0ACC1XVK8_MELAZ|nr:S-acyltransferase [Melia azedarach]
MAKPKRVYQVWKGRNKFICNGMLIFGPDAKSLVVTLLLLLVPIVIFCTHVARNLLHEVSSYNASYAILLVAILLTVYVLVLLFLTSARDPGIVPRNLHPPEEDVTYDSSASLETGTGTQTPIPRIPRTKEVLFNGMVVKVKYCDTCKLYRPPRCSHCSVCDNCVERFDHHCPWVGQCIGQRNYRYFFLFVSSAALLCIFIFAMSALHVKFEIDYYGTVWKAMKESPASIILMAYAFFFLWFVGGLTCFHVYLIATNQTTYENFRHRREDTGRAYDRGCLNNFFEVFCTKIKPSRNNFRAYAQENEPRPLTRRTPEAQIDRRAKVEDDREIGGDLLKISQRRDAE